MNKNILEVINKVAKQQNLKVTLTEESKSHTLKDLGLDSLSVIGLIVGVEDELSIKITDEDLVKIKTVEQLVSALEKAKKI